MAGSKIKWMDCYTLNLVKISVGMFPEIVSAASSLFDMLVQGVSFVELGQGFEANWAAPELVDFPSSSTFFTAAILAGSPLSCFHFEVGLPTNSANAWFPR